MKKLDVIQMNNVTIISGTTNTGKSRELIKMIRERYVPETKIIIIKGDCQTHNDNDFYRININTQLDYFSYLDYKSFKDFIEDPDLSWILKEFSVVAIDDINVFLPEEDNLQLIKYISENDKLKDVDFIFTKKTIKERL